MSIFWWSSLLYAASIERTDWQLVIGRDPNRLVVKFHEESGIGFESLPEELTDPSLDVQPLFGISAKTLNTRYTILRKEHTVEDLQTYIVIQAPSEQLDEIAKSLVYAAEIEHIYRDFLPVNPPNDIDPPTPSFYDLQLDHLSAPIGLGFSESQRWTMGAGIRIANIEYSYDPAHEDLLTAPVVHAWGWDVQRWQFHGNSVLGQLIASTNEYGVKGAVPEAEVLMISPYEEEDVYNVAEALLQSLDFLIKGDVILIEQQMIGWESYCPVEYNPAVFDAIQWAVAEGISVVEPSGNGSQDLDAEQWAGWFNLDIQDSGAIMVGGGGEEPQTWSGGSSFGSRMDVQGWYQNIVTTGTNENADLFFPLEDSRQSYTQFFGGTSGASPQIVSVVVAINALTLQLGQATDDPILIREMLRQNGLSQPIWDQDFLIGNQPNLDTFLRMWAW